MLLRRGRTVRMSVRHVHVEEVLERDIPGQKMPAADSASQILWRTERDLLPLGLGVDNHDCLLLVGDGIRQPKNMPIGPSRAAEFELLVFNHDFGLRGSSFCIENRPYRPRFATHRIPRQRVFQNVSYVEQVGNGMGALSFCTPNRYAIDRVLLDVVLKGPEQQVERVLAVTTAVHIERPKMKVE